MFDVDFAKSWYYRRWLAPAVEPRPGRVARILASLGTRTVRGLDNADSGSWRIPPL